MIIISKKKFIATIVLFVLLCLAISSISIMERVKTNLTNTKATQQAEEFIIDAGHGGEDGGASSNCGLKEKILNLDMALKVGTLLELCGYKVTYIRQKDISVDNGNKFNKRQDILNRINTVNKASKGILLSFHMNSFPQEKYFGAQIFYNNTEIAKTIAENIQTQIQKTIDVNNIRKAKKAPDTALLFVKSNKPSILIECGFLSNKVEAEKLSTDSYRMELSLVVFSAIIK